MKNHYLVMWSENVDDIITHEHQTPITIIVNSEDNADDIFVNILKTLEDRSLRKSFYIKIKGIYKL